MKAVFGEQYASSFTMGLSRSGRALAAGERFVFSWIALSVVGTLFYLPDYVGRYRAQEPVAGMFFVLLGAVCLLTSLMLAALRYFRSEIWVVNPAQGVLIYQTSRWLGLGQRRAAVDLGAIERFRSETRPGLADSQLLVQFGDGGGARMLVARLSSAAIDQLAGQLAVFLSEHRIDIPVERGSESISADGGSAV